MSNYFYCIVLLKVQYVVNTAYYQFLHFQYSNINFVIVSQILFELIWTHTLFWSEDRFSASQKHYYSMLSRCCSKKSWALLWKRGNIKRYETRKPLSQPLTHCQKMYLLTTALLSTISLYKTLRRIELSSLASSVTYSKSAKTILTVEEKKQNLGNIGVSFQQVV